MKMLSTLGLMVSVLDSGLGGLVSKTIHHVAYK